MHQGIADANPVAGTAPPAAERKRDRVLSAKELRSIWTATLTPEDFNTIIRLLILTGQRREEVGGMRWNELDLEGRVWSLPSNRTKNGRPHDIPLSEAALQILRSRRGQTDRVFVFGEGKGPFSG
ncbi:MAG: tyrosine-type recombinase/integrase [Geminicoccales bacterium]